MGDVGGIKTSSTRKLDHRGWEEEDLFRTFRGEFTVEVVLWNGPDVLVWVNGREDPGVSRNKNTYRE